MFKNFYRPPFGVSHTCLVFLTSALSSVPVISYAEEKSTNDHTLDEVVVQALRLPSTLAETGSSVWVVDEELIRTRGYLQMTDALTSVPGLTINQNGAFGGQAAARIRGASSDQTLVLLDGILINDVTSPGGGFNFGAIDVSDVQRVEVLKGPQSTLWGSDAIGGVINIVSKTPTEQLTGNVGVTTGSFGTQQYRATASGGNGTADFRISYNDLSTDGISKADKEDGNSEKDPFDSQTLSLKGGVNLPMNARLQVNHRTTEASTAFDSFGPATGVQDGDEVSETELSNTLLTLTIPAFDGRLKNTLKYGETSIERDNFSNGSSSFSAEGDRTVLQYQGNFTISDAHQISVGYEDEETDNGTTKFSNTGIYALYQVNPLDTLTVSMGIRQDDNNQYGSEIVSRVSAVWSANENIDLRASWGEGFKVPTLFQTTFFCCGATGPNADLEAEKSDAFDIGVDWRFLDNNGTVSLTVFSQDTENQIDFSFAVGGYKNIAQVDTQGVELAVQYQFTESLYSAASFAYIDSEDGNGNELTRLPKLTGDLTLNWQPMPQLNTTLVVVYNDDEQDSRGVVSSWTRIDLSAVYQFNDHVDVIARIENLGDKDYQQIFGYGTPQRSGYVGVTYSF